MHFLAHIHLIDLPVEPRFLVVDKEHNLLFGVTYERDMAACFVSEGIPARILNALGDLNVTNLAFATDNGLTPDAEENFLIKMLMSESEVKRLEIISMSRWLDHLENRKLASIRIQMVHDFLSVDNKVNPEYALNFSLSDLDLIRFAIVHSERIEYRSYMAILLGVYEKANGFFNDLAFCDATPYHKQVLRSKTGIYAEKLLKLDDEQVEKTAHALSVKLDSWSPIMGHEKTLKDFLKQHKADMFSGCVIHIPLYVFYVMRRFFKQVEIKDFAASARDHFSTSKGIIRSQEFYTLVDELVRICGKEDAIPETREAIDCVMRIARHWRDFSNEFDVMVRVPLSDQVKQDIYHKAFRLGRSYPREFITHLNWISMT